MPNCRGCTIWWRPRDVDGPLPGARRFADLARRLYTMVAEVTELTEKVDNALQVTEDVYLARIYIGRARSVPRSDGQRRGGSQAVDHPGHLYRPV